MPTRRSNATNSTPLVKLRHRGELPSLTLLTIIITTILFGTSRPVTADSLTLMLQDQIASQGDSGDWETRDWTEEWEPGETAIIVCDVWDLHHCLNAVRRLEQFVPRLDRVLATARDQGVTIIHAPSDCMKAYEGHAARRRARQAPEAAMMPPDVANWCSAIPAEESAEYPIDQSDGGEDDDPEEHQAWVEKLRAMGRNPGTPWKSQHDAISIDEQRDFISDRGDEIWNVLESRGIDNVILAGVHLNMCVLGRPFGLRQMVRNGKRVVLMRDMTDTMYNPRRWPYVSHQRGTELMVSHVERHICPTVTSNQIVGGEPFKLKTVGEGQPESRSSDLARYGDYQRHWVTVQVPGRWSDGPEHPLVEYQGPAWYRCIVRLDRQWATDELKLALPDSADPVGYKAWLNGEPLALGSNGSAFLLDRDNVVVDDANLLVVRVDGPKHAFVVAPALVAGTRRLELAGRWQFRVGDDESFANMRLPARFGGAADIVFCPDDPPFVARALTKPRLFTPGIEGPACDAEGNIFAVNFLKQGTIGRVTPTGTGEVFVILPAGSIGNGIRFREDGSFVVADYTEHNILSVDPASKRVTVLAHNSKMNQPNDLTMDADGTLYASDPNWSEGTGQIWRIDTDGTTTLLASDMGTTNGIEVSPDGSTLYVNESVQRNIWAFTIQPDRTLTDKRLLRKFDDHGFDGMRCDVDGNLYVTRYGKGTVVQVSPEGQILREIQIPGRRPSNICFGGPDGRTAYVTEVEFARLVTFRVDRPGLAWSRNFGEGR